MRYIQMNNLHRWSKSWNTLTIRYGQILINVSSSPIGPDPVWNTAVVPCRQAGILIIKKVESLFVRSIRCKAILSRQNCGKAARVVKRPSASGVSKLSSRFSKATEESYRQPILYEGIIL